MRNLSKLAIDYEFERDIHFNNIMDYHFKQIVQAECEYYVHILVINIGS